MVRSSEQLTIRLMEGSDIPTIVRLFQSNGWPGRMPEVYQTYLLEQGRGERIVLLAFVGVEFAGHVTVQWRSAYPEFNESGIPEITDLNVLPAFRRRRIATRLVDEAEERVFAKSALVGIGFGVSADYGPAQRMYVKRGYVPDGRGSFQVDRFVRDDATVQVFDCIIHLTKERPV